MTTTRKGRDNSVEPADECARLKQRDRHVGLTAELPEKWVEAVRHAKVPDDHEHLDTELK